MKSSVSKIHELKKDDETLDTFYHGKILVLQKKKGYRFSIDAPLLADFIQTRKSDELLELGTGSGIISLLLTIKPLKKIIALEIQESLADLAQRNVILNNLQKKITILHGDLSSFSLEKRFDVIFSNPPYQKWGTGNLSPSLEKTVARHEIKCDINDILTTTARLLKKRGRAYFIYRIMREEDFKTALDKTELKIKKIRYVKPKFNSPANLFLVELDFVSNSSEILPPLIIYNEQQKYTEEIQEIFAGRIYDSTN
ncbi:MAG: tRNA1(Val) (adenine(37)-N6)-methyltransferase [Candidatus Aminicenantia bacterium]